MPNTPSPSLATLATHPHLLTTKDMATLARCSERHILNQVEEGLLRKVPNLGRSVRFHPREALAFFGLSEAAA
jgi:hypothetical protein